MTDSVHIKFQALVEKLKAAWNRLPEEYRYPEILEVIDAVSDLPCECTDRTKMELDAVRAVEGYSSPPNIVVPEAESGPAPLRTLLRRVHEWNDSDELDAIPIMAEVEETLIHMLDSAALLVPAAPLEEHDDQGRDLSPRGSLGTTETPPGSGSDVRVDAVDRASRGRAEVSLPAAPQEKP